MNSLVLSDFSEDSRHSSFSTYTNSEYVIRDYSILSASKQSSISDDVMVSLFVILSDNIEKESFYVKAIKNLLKQKRYSNLLYQLSTETISEDDFSEELIQNESNYLIKVDETLETLSRLKNLMHVIDRIDEDLYEEDLMEMFSISDSFIIKDFLLKKFLKNISNESSL